MYTNVRWPTSDILHPNQLTPHLHHNHTTLTLNGCGVVVVRLWCELVWVKDVTSGPP